MSHRCHLCQKKTVAYSNDIQIISQYLILKRMEIFESQFEISEIPLQISEIQFEISKIQLEISEMEYWICRAVFRICENQLIADI